MAARRAPGAEDRLRDAERSRELILDAALYEFGERGFAGARTVAIARRAGVNPQLISYYFDGKAGLYRALTARIRGETGPLDDLDTPLEEVVARFVHVNLEHRAWARLLIWEALSPGWRIRGRERRQRRVGLLPTDGRRRRSPTGPR